MDGKKRGDTAKFDGKVAITDRIHRILRDFGPAFAVHETEQFGNQLALERKSRAGKCSAAERADVDALKTLAQTFAVTREHFDVREQMMREIDGLGALQVGVAGNNDTDFLSAEFNE